MHWVVHRPVATWMITIAFFVFGVVSYQRLPLNLMPDLSYPTITIRTEADGYAPEEIEDQISRQLEEAVATTQGLTHIESRSRAGLSEILLSFKWDSSLDQSIQDVRERIQRVFLPNDIKRPLLLRYDPSSAPIVRLAVSGGSNLTRLREFCENTLKRDLEAIDGIAAVRVRGGEEKEVQVLVREDWLAAKNSTIEEIFDTLSAENINMPAGSLLEGDREYLVRTLNAFTTVEELKTLKINRADGTQVLLSELAEIDLGNKERSVMSRLNAQEAVELEIYKTADANIVQITDQLKSRLFSKDDGLENQLPEGTTLKVLEDQASFIEAAINNLKSTAILGAFCAISILFLFLRNFRATAIIGAAIPLSIVVTFAPIYISGVSLNLMSLGGLALGIGMLVDNAVVVLENIQVHLDRGSTRKEAAAKGTAEVAMAVTASTLTTISVFLPISFVDGIAGQIFTDLSLAVVFSLIASLVVALFFVPMLAAREFKFPQSSNKPSFRNRFRAWGEFKARFTARSIVRKLIGLIWDIPYLILFLSYELLSTLIIIPALYGLRFSFYIGRLVLPFISKLLIAIANRFYVSYSFFERSYGYGLPPLLSRPGRVVVSAVVIFVLSLSLARSLGQSLIPELHQGRFFIDAELSIGTPLGKTSSESKKIESLLSEAPDVAYIHSIIGADASDDRSGAGEHSIRYLIGVQPSANPQKTEQRVMDRLRSQLQNEGKLLNIQFSRPSLFQFKTPFSLVLYGDELEDLPKLSTIGEQRLSNLPMFTDIQSSLSEGYPELQIEYDRDRLKKLGLSSANVAQSVRKKIQGEKATTLSTKEDRLELIVRLIERDRRDIQQLRNLNINPKVSPEIPLSSVAKITQTKGPSEIRRIDQQRAVVISANVQGFDLLSPKRAIEGAFADQANWEITGQSQELAKSSRSMIFAVSLAIFLVYVIMASTFEHIIHPLVILFTVPLAVIGVILCLWALSVPLSIVVFIGIIVLAGVVVNNAIVLIDTINRMRVNGSTIFEATTSAATLRLRPILITTLTTALGLLPLALGYGEGAEIQQPLALTIIAGLLSSTALTLLVIPALYLVFGRDQQEQT